jgi:hypothetical protein
MELLPDHWCSASGAGCGRCRSKTSSRSDVTGRLFYLPDLDRTRVNIQAATVGQSTVAGVDEHP